MIAPVIVVFHEARQGAFGTRHRHTRSTYARHRIRHGIRHREVLAGRRPRPHVPNARLRHMLIGYARVSKADGSQSLDLQRGALQASGVDAVNVDEMVSGRHPFAGGSLTQVRTRIRRALHLREPAGHRVRSRLSEEIATNRQGKARPRSQSLFGNPRWISLISS